MQVMRFRNTGQVFPTINRTHVFCTCALVVATGADRFLM